MSVSVFKLGGSLLDLPNLRVRLETVLGLRPGTLPLFVVGGGDTANLVRRWDALHELGDEAAHWLAIDAMALNERLLAALWTDVRIVSNRDEAAAAWQDDYIPVINTATFLRTEEEKPGVEELMPRSWEATSDSIAAWISGRWPAEELVLLKSCDPSAGEATDPAFQNFAAAVSRIGWVNLRDEHPAIQVLQPPLIN